MNKKIFIALFLLSIPIIGYTDEHNKKIDFQQIVANTRSLNAIPEASICDDILTISFNGSGIYSLYIEDNTSTTVWVSALPADGMEYDFDLSCIGNGTFRIVLVGMNGEYEGYFTIY